MANGNSGDHPQTDILVHNTQVYGREADDLIRQIADCAVVENWTIGGSAKSAGPLNSISSLLKVSYA